ncbi:Cof-type HAD-IIB family hydrolase [Yersinia kristensenii]|uniref:Cof-type HAD-IIB family hydrolase n=1 Tax=Yersinia kristensenii TaxID=28152 RepID=UPI003896EFB2
MIKLIITDLDGTFLDDKGDYNRILFQDIKEIMSQKGVHFALCTGKQCERVEELFKDDAEQFWIMGDSATRIKYQGEYVYQSLIKNQLGLKIIATLEAINKEPVIIACTSEGAFIKSSVSTEMENKIKKSYTKVTKVDSFSQTSHDFVKISVYDEKGRCPEFKPHLHEFFDKAYIVVSEDAWIDIADVGVHKGHTVEILQKLLNVNKDETMVFGDGLNDIELMERATFSFAMRNAFEETKSAANFITGKNTEDAVMLTIQRILTLQ